MSIVVYHVEVSGRTYVVRDQLKNLGLWWDGEKKVWRGAVSEWDLMKLRKLADKYKFQIEVTKRHELRSKKQTNSTWVRCWACGRLVPPGQATRDVNGEWYCGC